MQRLMAHNNAETATDERLVDPTTLMLSTQLLALEPFASMSVEELSQVAIAIQIPAWLVPSPYACNFREAAEETFGRAMGLENPSSSAYTALGYELCRVDQEAYDCKGPGRLANLEYDGHLAVASIIKTPVDNLDHLNTHYSTWESSSSLELSSWISSFLQVAKPDLLTIAGSDLAQNTLLAAIAPYNITEKLCLYQTFKSADLLEAGAAQVAKDTLETHGSDCASSMSV